VLLRVAASPVLTALNRFADSGAKPMYIVTLPSAGIDPESLTQYCVFESVLELLLSSHDGTIVPFE